jgi:hypothetical protein
MGQDVQRGVLQSFTWWRNRSSGHLTQYKPNERPVRYGKDSFATEALDHLIKQRSGTLDYLRS